MSMLHRFLSALQDDKPPPLQICTYARITYGFLYVLSVLVQTGNDLGTACM